MSCLDDFTSSCSAYRFRYWVSERTKINSSFLVTLLVGSIKKLFKPGEPFAAGSFYSLWSSNIKKNLPDFVREVVSLFKTIVHFFFGLSFYLVNSDRTLQCTQKANPYIGRFRTRPKAQYQLRKGTATSYDMIRILESF